MRRPARLLFAALASTGTNNAFVDNVTLPGWYSTDPTYVASDGASATGSLDSFGATGSPERALGSVASGTTGTLRYGLRIRNGTGAPLTSFTMTYVGEQWRDGGGTSSPANVLTFAYAIDATSLTSGTYVDVPALSFTALVNGGGTTSSGGAVDGTTLRAQRTATVSGISLAAGQDLFLRFSDPDDPGSALGLAARRRRRA